MLETFEIKFSSGNYAVTIGSGFIVQGHERRDNCNFEIIDENISHLWPEICKIDSIKILATEENKTLIKVSEVIERLRGLGANRQSHLQVYGGGVVQDISTFIASSYMRGISWTYCPTTLLGMVDSCIGGKSSLNVGIYKNIAGNFYPPKNILIDVDFCKTLEVEELVAGLCEVVKICFASDGNEFEDFLSIFSGSPIPLIHDKLIKLVKLSLITKKRFIEEDEFDEGVRLHLNFGHTFGHAIEAGTSFLVTHGVAVGLGMLAELDLSEKIGVLPKGNVRVGKLKSYIYELLKYVPNLQKNIETLDFGKALSSFKSDKKHRNNFYHVIVANGDGYLQRGSLPINGSIDRCIESILKNLKEGAGVEI